MSITGFEMSKFVCPNCRNDSIEVSRSSSVKGGKPVYNLHCRTCGKRSVGYAENLREWKR